MDNQDRPYTSAEAMNEALLSLYESRLPKINELIAKCIEANNWDTSKVSKPFFMKVEEEYTDAATKVLFIGRETFGWELFDSLDSVADLMAVYGNSSLYEGHHNSPFWWFRKQLSQQLGITESFKKATMWTNLSKIDVDKKRPTGKGFDTLMQVFMNLLVDEIAIIRPDVILIMTKDGWYNWHINNYGWVKNEPFVSPKAIELGRESVLPKKIDRLVSPHRLPEHTYHICHPNALRRKKGGYTNNANELIQPLIERIKA